MSWDRVFCTKASSTACSLDRTHVLECSLTKFSQNPPSQFNYFGNHYAGSLAEMDYCPYYQIELVNRVCTNASASSWIPYTNINIMREVFSPNSRCLTSTLRAGYTSGFRSFSFD